MQDVRLEKPFDINNAVNNNNSDNRLASVLAEGTGGLGQYVPEEKEKINVKNREKKLEHSAKQHAGATKEDYYQLAKKEFGLEKEVFLNLPEDKFNEIAAKIESFIEEQIDNVFDNTEDSKEALRQMNQAQKFGADFETSTEIAQQNIKDSDIKDVVENTNTAKEEGLNTKDAVKISVITSKPLIEIINDNLPKGAKKYKDISDISYEDLKAIIKKFLSNLPTKNDSDKDYYAKTAAVRCILQSLKGIEAEDFKRILDAIEEVAPEVSDSFKNIQSLLKSLKANPKALNRWIESNEFQQVLVERGFNPDEIKTIIRDVAKIINDGDPNDKYSTALKIMEKLRSYSPEAKYKELCEKYEKDSNSLSKRELDFKNDYGKFLKLSTTDENQLSKEDKIWLENYKKTITDNLKNLDSTFGAALATFDTKFLEELKVHYPEKFDLIIKQYIEYANNDSSIKLDKDYLDSITDGKFTKIYNESIAENTKESETCGFSNAPEATCTNASNNVAELKSQLYAQTKINEREFTIEGTKSSNKGDKSNPDDIFEGNILSKPKETIVLGLAKGKYKINDVLSKCTASLNNAVGKVTLAYFGKLTSDEQKANELNKVGSFIARDKIINLNNYNFGKLKKVVLPFALKREQEEKAQKKENS